MIYSCRLFKSGTSSVIVVNKYVRKELNLQDNDYVEVEFKRKVK